MPRYESKFVISLPQYESLRNSLIALAQSDPHAIKRQAYPVFSAYFDTPDLKYFYQKLDGDFEHIKVRLRRYASMLSGPGICFLEVKAKHDQEQIKERQPLLYTPELLDPGTWWLRAEEAFDQIHPWLPESPLIHVCNVYYEREAFEASFDGAPIRLNFDHNIAYLRPEEQTATARLLRDRDILGGQRVVLEVKGEHPELPESLHALLAHLQPEQARVSKYSEAILNLDIVGCYGEVVA